MKHHLSILTGAYHWVYLTTMSQELAHRIIFDQMGRQHSRPCGVAIIGPAEQAKSTHGGVNFVATSQ